VAALLPALLAGAAVAVLLGVADGPGRLSRVLRPGPEQILLGQVGSGAPGAGARGARAPGRGPVDPARRSPSGAPHLLPGPAAAICADPRPPRRRLGRLLLAAREPEALATLPVRVAAAGGAGVGGALLGGAAAGAVAAAAAVALLVAVSSRRTALAVAAERRSAVEACAALAAELRSGRAAAPALDAAALVSAGPLRSILQAGSAAARFGGDVPAALLDAPAGRATAVPELPRGLAACWQVCAGTGSGLAAAVERLEEGLRAREVARRAVDAELAGPRATAGLLALLPLGGIGLAAALGAGPVHVLLHTPAGNVCLLAGVARDLTGVVWTRALARRAAAAV
jgi:tight adherence protein B